MGTYSTIDCCEVAESAKEDFDDEQGLMKASVQLKCLWTNRHALVADVCGNRRAWPWGAPGPVPLAATAGIVPFGQPLAPSGQMYVPEEALVTVNYTTAIVEQGSESIEPTAEFITLDHKRFRWGSGSGALLQEDEAPGRLVR